MPRATFSFGTKIVHTMEVDWRWWGREAYFVDGELLENRWTWSPVAKRELRIGSHTIRIEAAVRPHYFTRVFLDDNVHVEELFPEVKANIEKQRRIITHPVWGLLMGLGVGIVAGWLWISTLWPSASLQRAGGSVIGLFTGFAVFLAVVAGYLLLKGVVGLRRLRSMREQSHLTTRRTRRAEASHHLNPQRRARVSVNVRRR